MLTQIAQQLPLSCKTLFPTFGKRSSLGGKSNREIKSSPKKTKKDIVHKDVVLLPSSDTRLVPTHQVQWRMENSGLVILIFPVDKSLQEEDFRAKIRELLERKISIHEVLVRINSITKVSQWRVFHCFTFPQACWTGTHLHSTRK